jgi:hypothetical protein
MADEPKALFRLQISRETLRELLAAEGPGPHVMALDGETQNAVDPVCQAQKIIPGHLTGTFSDDAGCLRGHWLEVILDPGGPVEEGSLEAE